jgi:hypothetical protein
VRRISRDPDIQGEFEAMVASGVSENLAEMFALQCPPSAYAGDRAFLEGTENGRQFQDNPELGDLYAADALASGVDIKGKVYKDTLARYPGDPTAWVSDTSDVVRIARERQLKISGSVKCDYMDHSQPPPPDVEIAEDIVQAEVANILTTVPDPHMVDTVDLAEQVREKRKPSKTPIKLEL